VLLQRDASPFQKVLAKFLTTNTLQTVCPWLQHIVGEEITPACVSQSPDDPPAFGYCLPLYTVNAQPLSTFMQLNPDARAVERIFGVPVGFFWETVETGDDECFPDPLTSDNSSGGVDGGFETAVMLVSNGLFRSGKALMAITGRTLQAGLSLAGVRLLYPTVEQAGTCPLKLLPRSKTKAADASHGPVLAVALRGFEARTAWLDAVGPFDPVLARRIDPTSLCALYGGDSRDACRIYCPRNPYQTTAALVRWFGGRVPDSRVIAVGESPPGRGLPESRVNPGRRPGKTGPASGRTAATRQCCAPRRVPILSSRCRLWLRRAVSRWSCASVSSVATWSAAYGDSGSLRRQPVILVSRCSVSDLSSCFHATVVGFREFSQVSQKQLLEVVEFLQAGYLSLYPSKSLKALTGIEGSKICVFLF